MFSMGMLLGGGGDFGLRVMRRGNRMRGGCRLGGM
jgi:hypothetical protein